MRRSFFLAAAALVALPAHAVADSARKAPYIPQAACSPVGESAQPAGAQSSRPLLLDGLGFAGLDPDSAHAEARAWFAQGVKLIWAFDEIEAARAFREAQRLDPACALCHLGEAWALSPTINLGPREELGDARRAAAARADALGRSLSPRDRLLVRAFVLRSVNSNGPIKYASLMENAAQRLPGDDLIAVLAADARMQVAETFAPGGLSQQLLERVLARNPEHGGAIHFYIHLTDWIDRQHLAEPFADRLGRIAPGASHLVHMPSHTYYGVGRYRDAAAVNVAAIAADRSFAIRARPQPSDYRRGLLSHNMHFAIESALARGDGATARDVSRQFAAEYLAGAAVDPRFRRLGTATFYAAGLHAPTADVLAFPEPEDALSKAARHYARGEALARAGDAAGVAAEATALSRLRTGAEAPELGATGGSLATIFEQVLNGRAAMLFGRHAEAATAYREAMGAQLAAGFGSDPPLFWYSVRRSLAAALLAQGDAQGARDQLYASLRRWPNDPLALYALSLADRRLGDTARANGNLARARAGWAGDVTQIPLARI